MASSMEQAVRFRLRRSRVRPAVQVADLMHGQLHRDHDHPDTIQQIESRACPAVTCGSSSTRLRGRRRHRFFRTEDGGRHDVRVVEDCKVMLGELAEMDGRLAALGEQMGHHFHVRFVGRLQEQ